MSKPVLGRKLGTLLKIESGKDVNPALLQGQSEESKSAPTPGAQPVGGSTPTWYWLGTDLLLVATALMITYESAGSHVALKRGVAVGAVALGGGIAVWALRGKS